MYVRAHSAQGYDVGMWISLSRMTFPTVLVFYETVLEMAFG